MIYMTFYQELQLNQAGSKNLLKKSETLKEKLYHMWVYLVKIAVTMAFCFFFVSILCSSGAPALPAAGLPACRAWCSRRRKRSHCPAE